MSRHALAPQRTRAGTPLFRRDLAQVDPYVQLAGAFLQRMLCDAQAEGRPGPAWREARAFLADRAAVAFWCELAAADVDTMLPALWAAVGEAEP